MSVEILKKVHDEILPGLELDLISQGAEALVFKSDKHPYLPNGPQCIVKYRPRKPYRHQQLDMSITKSRTAGEAKLLGRLYEVDGVCVPRLVAVDAANGVLWMEHIEGPSVKQWLWDGQDKEKINEKLKAVGAAVGSLHATGIVHGDLTTSNVLLQGDEGVPTLIDFGLASYSTLAEDRAVDLYVLERALQSTHSREATAGMESVLNGYMSVMSGVEASAVDRRLKQVRSRGRKRSLLG